MSLWYSAFWIHRIKITIQKDMIPETLTNFPVMIDFSTLPAVFHQYVNQTDARDIRITKDDGITEVPREIVNYNSANDTGHMFFKADSISATVNTEFYLYYGNDSATEPAAGDTYGKNNVWKSDYLCVWHMEDLNDSTSHGKTLSNTGASTTTGKMGNGYNFPKASPQCIYRDDDANFQRDGNLAWQMSCWIYFNSLPTDGFTDLVLSQPAAHNLNTGVLNCLMANEKYYYQHVYKLHGYTWDGDTVFTGDEFIQINTWYHCVVKHDGSNLWAVINGVAKASDAVGTITSGFDSFVINYGATSGNSDHESIDGIVDEVHFLTAVQTDNWDIAEFRNQNSPSTFYQVGNDMIPPFNYSPLPTNQ